MGGLGFRGFGTKGCIGFRVWGLRGLGFRGLGITGHLGFGVWGGLGLRV